MLYIAIVFIVLVIVWQVISVEFLKQIYSLINLCILLPLSPLSPPFFLFFFCHQYQPWASCMQRSKPSKYILSPLFHIFLIYLLLNLRVSSLFLVNLKVFLVPGSNSAIMSGTDRKSAIGQTPRPLSTSKWRLAAVHCVRGTQLVISSMKTCFCVHALCALSPVLEAVT